MSTYITKEEKVSRRRIVLPILFSCRDRRGGVLSRGMRDTRVTGKETRRGVPLISRGRNKFSEPFSLEIN